MSKRKFCESFVRLDGAPISFAGRPYLDEIYGVTDRNLVIRASRQVEKSTFLVITIIYEVTRNPQARILFVCPRDEQARVFSRFRMLTMLMGSPLIKRYLIGRRNRIHVTNITFNNGAELYLRSAFHNADGCRGLSANWLLVDEVQDVAPGALPVLTEVMSHAHGGRTILTGTPKLSDNHLESYFSQSTANYWTMTCDACSNAVTIEERTLGPTSLICSKCGQPVDPARGMWVPRNPSATWGSGFTISHPMVPWIDYPDVLERQRTYDPVTFRNEVLGLPTTLGDHVVTRAELEACCTELPMSAPQRIGGAPLVAGIDWGGGMVSRTVLVIGTMRPDFTFQVQFVRAFHAHEDPNQIVNELARQCCEFQVDAIAADGNGNGHVYNRLLFDRIRPRRGYFGIYYSAVDQRPTRDGVLFRWTVSRSPSIGVLFGRVKRKQLLFPRRQDIDPFLDEFACETAEHDDHTRTVKYTHPENQRDDALHAANYALLLATRGHNAPTFHN